MTHINWFYIRAFVVLMIKNICDIAPVLKNYQGILLIFLEEIESRVNPSDNFQENLSVNEYW